MKLDEALPTGAVLLHLSQDGGDFSLKHETLDWCPIDFPYCENAENRPESHIIVALSPHKILNHSNLSIYARRIGSTLIAISNLIKILDAHNRRIHHA